MSKPSVAGLAIAVPLAFCAGFIANGMVHQSLQGDSFVEEPAPMVVSEATTPQDTVEAAVDTQNTLRVMAGNGATDPQGNPREIVCWGDSMTEGVGAGPAVITDKSGTSLDVSGMSYPQVLNQLTGFATCNFGVVGATSRDVAVMAGGLKGEVVIEDHQEDVAEVVALSQEHQGDILILEMGSNGGWSNDYDLLIAQYDAIIEQSGCEDYLIIGDTDDPGTSLGDVTQYPFSYGEGPDEPTAWEAALRDHYGRHFVNTRVYLLNYGLELAGLAPTDQDEKDALYGCISTQLRADWTHLNSYGYYAKAQAIYQCGVELGFWDIPEDEA